MAAPLEDRKDLMRDFAVLLHVGPHNDELRASFECAPERHGGFNAKRTCLVRSGKHNRAPAGTRNRDGFSAQFGIVANLDARVKSIDVEVRDHISWPAPLKIARIVST